MSYLSHVFKLSCPGGQAVNSWTCPTCILSQSCPVLESSYSASWPCPTCVLSCWYPVPDGRLVSKTYLCSLLPVSCPTCNLSYCYSVLEGRLVVSKLAMSYLCPVLQLSCAGRQAGHWLAMSYLSPVRSCSVLEGRLPTVSSCPKAVLSWRTGLSASWPCPTCVLS
jgi:hypothetical protein